MNAPDYKEMVMKIRAELEVLENQQEETGRRIARLKQALIGLVPLSESESRHAGLILENSLYFMEPTTLTGAARQILQAAEAPLAPTAIKQQLINMGQDLSDQKNVMASIHSLLKRLVGSDEIETKDNGLTYSWKRVRRRTWLSASDRDHK
jgi:hypothetical protein